MAILAVSNIFDMPIMTEICFMLYSLFADMRGASVLCNPMMMLFCLGN